MANRQMIYIPELFPETFVLFYYQGDLNGRSYSLRDYSRGGSPVMRSGLEQPWSAGEILGRATHKFDAERVSTGDCQYWQAETLKLNQKYLSSPQRSAAQIVVSALASRPAASLPGKPARQPEAAGSQFPVLAEEALRAHPVKAKKTGDLNRIFTSPVSEDYVTWNVAQLLLETPPERWWPGLLDLAQEDQPLLDLAYDPGDCPALHLWRKYPAPREYERRSRERMARSGNPDWEARSRDPGPVEGPSEIDFIAEGKGYLLFAEAKLGSDISERTTYDPARNQISRNIDVLLEACGSRKPVFWMLVKEKDPHSRFMQTIQRYREDPAALAADLPHRDPQVLRRVVQNMAVLRWRDILALLPVENDDRPAVREMRRRVDPVYAASHPALVLTPAPVPAAGLPAGNPGLPDAAAKEPVSSCLTGILWLSVPGCLCSFLYWVFKPQLEPSQVFWGVIIVLAIAFFIWVGYSIPRK